MSSFARSEIEVDGVSMATTEDGEGITIRMTGNADSRVKDRLQELLLQTHAEARDRHLPRVAVDLRALEFMSSSCFKAFVSWLAEVRKLEPAEQYRIHFLSDQQIHWQRRSLHALSCFAAELVHIEHQP
jgi:hypothetical protein